MNQIGNNLRTYVIATIIFVGISGGLNFVVQKVISPAAIENSLERGVDEDERSPVTGQDTFASHFKNKKRHYVSDTVLNDRFTIIEYAISIDVTRFPKDTYYIMSEDGTVHFSSTFLSTMGGVSCIVSGASLVITKGSADQQDQFFKGALEEGVRLGKVSKIQDTYYIAQGPQDVCSEDADVKYEQRRISDALKDSVLTIRKVNFTGSR